MCFHLAMTRQASKNRARFKAASEILDQKTPVYHVSAFQNPIWPVLILINGVYQMCDMQWGLVPAWVKLRKQADEIRQKTYNARSETIFEKSSFRDAVITGRCIIPASGFYEWQHAANIKTPYFISDAQFDRFAMAGIFAVYKDEDQIEHKSFSIVTHPASGLLAEIHNSAKRQPMFLSEEEDEMWCRNNLTPGEIAGMFLARRETAVDAYTVENNFIHKASDDATCLQKAQGPRQQTFF